METVIKKIIDNYWIGKLGGRTLVNTTPPVTVTQTCSAFIANREITYFNKLTAGNDTAAFTVLLAVYNILAQRYFGECELIAARGLLYAFNTIGRKTVKDHLQEVKEEVQRVYKYAAYDGVQPLEAYATYGFAYNDKAAALPCSFIVNKQEAGLELVLNFSEDLLEPSVADHFLQNMQRWITGLSAYINEPAATIPLISEEERQVLLNVFNDTQKPVGKAQTLVTVFEARVQECPDNTAVIFKDTSLTYRQLNETANQFAAYIQQTYNITAGDLVGIKLQRSEQLLIAILGALKAGAAYVPMDVDYPAERLAYIEQDSQCRLVVDDKVLNGFKAQQSQFAKENGKQHSRATDLAYIIYTSGTTGKPKGVMITHSNAVELIHWAQSEFDASVFEVVYAATSHCFDLSVFEMFYTLSAGRKIRLLHNALEIGKYLQQDTGILLNTVPSAMRSLLDEGHDLKNVRCINLAGEPFPVDIAKRLTQPDVEVRNLYGPSEDTTYSTCYKLSGRTYKTIPIGKPVSNTQVYILDDHLQLLPVGVIGKLYISGAGLSKGYLNRPELNKEKFISNPYKDGALMYDTGDLARWMPDGNIEFSGRKDHQLKLRGYRIEPGEIENAMLAFSGNILQAVVDQKDQFLAGYYVANVPVDTALLRGHLGAQLPAYMVPAHFIQLPSIPLSVNGKVDRKALRALSWNAPVTSSYVPPRNAEEEQLAAIWQEVLGVEKVGIQDHFFELGGHSLMISQIINRMYKTMGKGVAFRLFYNNPTIETLSKALRNEQFTPIHNTTLSASYPATPSQRRLWLLSQLDGGMEAYRIFGAQRLKGRLLVDCFEKAFAFVVARHEILRTCFGLNEQGELQQYILPELQQVITVKDLSAAAEPEQALEGYIQTENLEKFELSRAPLFHAALVKLGEDDHAFVLSIHHILADGWSLEVLTAEVLTVYNQLQQGKAAALPELAIQFKDYAVWLSAAGKTPSFTLSREYWLQQFAGEVPVLKLPAFRSRPLVKTFNGSQLRHSYSQTFTDRLKYFAQEHQLTPFMLLMTGVKILLSRYSNQYDITVGTPIAGREHPDLEGQVGLYLNTLAIRTVFDGNDTFLEALQKEKKQLLDAYAHQEFPFDSLVEALDLERETSRSPLFDVMVVLQNQQQLNSFRHQPTDLVITEHPITQNTAHFDLTFIFTENDTFSLEIAYNTDIYDEVAVKRIFFHLENLFAQTSRFPDTRIKNIDLLTAAEKQLLLEEYNSCKADVGPEANIVEKFARQVALYPNQPAVVFEGRELTYAALDERSNQLAHYLLQHYNIAAEDLVMVKLERSEWMIVTLMAILKLGAAYVPVDPEYPGQRIQHILQDTQAKVQVDAELIQKVTQTPGLSTAPLGIRITGNHLAYAIYTSGSTGLPKGVMISHKNLLHFLAFYNVGIHRTALTANYVFDAAVMEIFAAITSGSTLIIPREETVMIPEAYAQFLYENRISHCYMHPMHLEQIATFLGKYDQVYLKRILAGVEGIKKEAVAWYHQNGVTILNAYGPTEATIVSTAYLVEDPDRITTANIPIGKPVPNYYIYILNEDTQVLQPHGAIGELCVSGPGVGRGYLNREELTREKFEASTFINGERIYRTGDLARWLPDGNIEFIGRKDQQVKIRGNRVELGEIEQVIHTCQPDLSHVLVEIKEVNGEKVLVAYYTTPEPIDKPALRSYLQEKLPGYMVPNYYVELADIPITINGKIDRRKLPDISDADIIRKTFVAPRNATEQKVIAIWKVLLGQRIIGVTDDFFELGGHSLLLTKLVNEYHRVFNVTIDLKELYANTTLEHHAYLLTTTEETSYEEIERAGEQAFYDLSPTQVRYWLLHKIRGKTKEFNIYNTFQLPANLDTDAFEYAFNALLERHEMLRTVFTEQEGIPKQRILPHEPVQIPCYQQEAAARNSVYDHAFDLGIFPLYKIALVKSASGFELFFNMHHIISDGWSMGIISRDLMELYRAKVAGSVPDIPELPVHYRDYAQWQNRLLGSTALAAQENYWKTALAGDPPYLQLPIDYANKAGKAATAAYYTVFIKEELKQKVRALSGKNATSIFAVFVAAFKVLLHRLTAEEDIIIGIPAANRNHYQLKDVVGCFLNTLMLRDKLNSDVPFEQFLQQVHHTLVQALANQNYPFEHLLEQLNIPKDDHRFPLSAVFLNLLDFEANTTAEIHDFEAVHGTLEAAPKFDLECYIKSLANGYSIHCVYDDELFKKETIAYWMEAYTAILAQVADHAAQAVSALNLFSEPAWQDEDVKPANAFTYFDAAAIQQSIARRFEEQVYLYSHHTAVFCNHRLLTYTQLNNNANHLARQLLAANTKQQRIALLLEHDETCVTGMLGVLKAGCAYVPIDVHNPLSRIRYILEDSGATILVCGQATLEKAQQVQQELPALTLVTLTVDEHIADTPNPGINIAPSAEAYILYTSGSTGTPKGVIQNQRNVLHFIKVYTNNVHIAATDNLSVFSTYTFDASVKDIYGAILNGAVVSLYDIKESGLHNLAAWIRAQHVSIIHMVPTIYRHFMKGLQEQELLETVRLVDLGGEPCVKADLDYFKKHFVKGAFLVNDYGPTESTIVSQKFMSHDTQLTRNGVPLGKAVANTTIFLLDAGHKKQGIYQEGEIAFCSEHLSLGYLNRPELTERAFILDPALGGRIYKSGDIGRMLPNGEIEFLQRKDTQVKLNGLRIELSEIEHQLGNIEGIKEAVVLLKEMNGNQLLTAYLCRDAELPTDEIKAILKNRLPKYMIPAIYISVAAFPLTRTGKIDRENLPEPTMADLKTVSYMAPENETESRLTTLWAEILKLDAATIGVKDNFFELGGNSLQAVVLINRINKTFDTVFSIEHLYDTLNVRELADLLEFSAMQSRHKGIPKATEKESYPVTPAQKRLWVLSNFEEGSAAYNMSSGLQLTGNFDEVIFSKAFKKLIERHESLRTYFKLDPEHGLRQYVLPQEAVTWETDLTDAAEEDAAEIIRRHYTHVFDLSKAPLVKVQVVKMAAQKYLLLFNLHHIICDGWSMEVLSGELVALYNTLLHGQPVELPALPVQYRDFSEWLISEAQQNNVKAAENYWLQKMSGRLPVLELPMVHKRPEIKTYNGATLDHRFAAGFYEALVNYTKQEGATLFMGLMAGINGLFYRYSGQTDIILGTPVAGREHADLEHQIGLYLNTLAIRTQFASGLTFKELLSIQRSTLIDAYKYQAYPFDALVDRLSLKRDLSRSALFDVMVVLQNQQHIIDAKPRAFDGATVKVFEKRKKNSQFDISFSFIESNGEIRVVAEYNTDLYNEAFIRSLLQHLEEFMLQCMVLPLQPIELHTENLQSLNNHAGNAVRQKKMII